MMCELLRQQAAPELEIDIFDGNPMDFHYFMAVFREVVENKVTDPRGRLTCLIKFTKGKAKEIAKNLGSRLPIDCLLKDSEITYNYSIVS